ncbi:MAG TPA: SusC/RagA family TonB-linked outer membrane protein [Balneolaceae bacterium]|nr:SusC/RagA family TonB-linked outer membrane protein [Balneolaceae bacterium]
MFPRWIQSVLLLGVVFMIGMTPALAQQTGTIEGTITNKKTGEPILNANVYIQSLNKGAATDADGNFTISDVPYGKYKMRISYIGYATRNVSVTVDQPTVTVNQTLSRSVAQLQNIVVTAYGVQQQQQNLTVSTQSVSSNEVQTTGASNFLQELSGRVSGLQVQSSNALGGSTKLVLRGHSSLTGNNQALIVVDGVPYPNQRYNTADANAGFLGYDFGNTGMDLSSDNIKSVTVLKGSAAAALYGSEAANGAILIQTKTGTAGQKTRITVTNSGGVSMIDRSTFPHYQKQYGAGYFPIFQQIKNPFPNATQDTITAARYQDDASFGPKFDASKQIYQWDSFYPGSPNYGKPEPWTVAKNMSNKFFKTGSNVKNGFQINGGISNGGYYSLGYSQVFNKGTVPNSKLNQNNFNLSAGYNLTSNFEVDGRFTYTRYKSRAIPQQGYESYLSSFRQWYETNVDILKQKAAYFRSKQNETWNLNPERTGPIYWNNPYWIQYQAYPTANRNRYRSQLSAKYNIADWFTLTGRAAIDNIHEYQQYRQNVGGITPAYYERYNNDHTQYDFYLLGHYKKQLTDAIQIYGVVGGAVSRTFTQSIDATTSGGLVVPGLYALSNSVNKIPFPTETNTRLGVNSEFIQFNADYNNYINLQLTARRDKSSSLPKKHNVYYYPSASASFTFSHFLDLNWLSLGKIRGSFASVGNSAPALSLINTYNRQDNFGSQGLYSLPGTLNNPNLKPEKKKSWEIGLNLGFFSNRVVVDGTFYKNNDLNEAIAVPVSDASGFDHRFINAGNVQNQGVDLTVKARPVVTSNFSWDATVNWSRNVNKVKKLAPGVNFDQFFNVQAGGVNFGAKVNGPYGAIRGYDFVRNKQGQRIIDSGGYYEITSTANHVIGNWEPKWTGGFSNTLSYKNLSLHFLIDVRAGGDIFSLNQWYGQGTGLYKSTVGLNKKGNPKRDPVSQGGGVLLKGVQQHVSNGDTTYTPNQTYKPYNALNTAYFTDPSARYIYDGSFVKLRQVSISYKVPKSLLNRWGLGPITDATFSVVGRNLWIIYKNLPSADPEQTPPNPNIQSGYDYGSMPSLRNISFQLKLHF